MVKIFWQVLVFSLLLFGGCEGCGYKKLSLKEEQQAFPRGKEGLGQFFIDPQSLFSKAQQFLFKSDMTMLLSKGDASETNQELIEIIGDAPRMHLKKKIDDAHFIELFSDQTTYYSKSQQGVFRKVSDNKPMYQGLFNDSFNGVAWFIEQFALGDRLVRESKGASVFVANNLSLDDAPFLKNLVGFPTDEIERASINCRIVVDEKTHLPLSGKFDVVVMGKTQFIKLAATLSLDLGPSGKKLVSPEVSDDEPLDFPVNIAPRFNELIHSRQGGRHDAPR